MAIVAARSESAPLTVRQREVLALVATGEPDKAIARRLGISERAIRFHLAESRARLGARSRSHLIAVALSNGLLDQQTVQSPRSEGTASVTPSAAVILSRAREIYRITQFEPRSPSVYVRHAERGTLIVASGEADQARRDALVEQVIAYAVPQGRATLAGLQRALAERLTGYLRARDVMQATVNADFPMLVADQLREAGVTLSPDEGSSNGPGNGTDHPMSSRA